MYRKNFKVPIIFILIITFIVIPPKKCYSESVDVNYELNVQRVVFYDVPEIVQIVHVKKENPERNVAEDLKEDVVENVENVVVADLSKDGKEETSIVEKIIEVEIMNGIQFPKNSLIFENGSIVEFVAEYGSQENVDLNDAVLDTGRSTNNDIIVWGHENRKFYILKNVSVGEVLILVQNGEISKYEVIRSELAHDNEEGTRIFAIDDGFDLVFGEYKDMQTIRIITCDSAHGKGYRWVITAQKL